MEKATSVLGTTVSNRLVAFVWYLQGMEAAEIATAVGVPVDTLNGLFKRVLQDGLSAFGDRRCSQSTHRPPVSAIEQPTTARIDKDSENIRISMEPLELCLNRDDALKSRIVLLTLLESNLLQATEVADALDLSEERLRKLRSDFRKNGAISLIDQRQGQTQEYAVPPRVKAELIRHYVEKTELGESVSAPALKSAIEQSGRKSPSQQTLRLHIKKLGLNHIKVDENQASKLKKGLLTI
jgi:transposase